MALVLLNGLKAMKTNAATLAAVTGLSISVCTSDAKAESAVFGVVDMALDISKQGLGTLTRLQSGSDWGSRFGIKGVKRISPGLSAVYWLESGFGADDGMSQQGGRLFGRQVYMGLSSEQLGRLTFGRQYSPENRMFWNIDAFNAGLAGGLPAIIPAGVARATLGRVDNSILWTSPDRWPGVTYVMYAPGEVAGNQRAGRMWGVSTRQKNDLADFNIGFVTQRNATDTGKLRNYTVGPAKLFTGWHRDWNSQANTPSTKGPEQVYDMFPFGVKYGVGAQATLIAQFVLVKDRTQGVANRNTNLIAIGGHYALSKRTVLFAASGRILNKNGSQYSLGGGLYAGGTVGPGNPTARTVQIGMRHNF